MLVYQASGRICPLEYSMKTYPVILFLFTFYEVSVRLNKLLDFLLQKINK